MNPMKKMMEPQSMSARDAPRRSEANPEGDTRTGRHRLGVGGRVGTSTGGRVREGACRTAATRPQSSSKSRDDWSPLGISNGRRKEGTPISPNLDPNGRRRPSGGSGGVRGKTEGRT